MISINSIEDVKLVKDKILQAGLYEEFKRLPDDYVYPAYGYFIVIESIEELQHPIPLKHSCLSHTPEPLSDYVEMIEKFKGYSQVVCILEADFGIVLFVNSALLSHKELLNVISFT